MAIMGFVSYFAIPINVVILLVCRFPSVQVGASQDLDTLLMTEKSILSQWLEAKDRVFWTRTNIIVFAILIEHCVIALKVVLAMIIPDVPHKVVSDEFRRERISAQVVKELLEIKFKGGHESFTDMTERLQKEASIAATEMLIEEENDAENGVEEAAEVKMKKKKAAKDKQMALLRKMADSKKAAMSQ